MSANCQVRHVRESITDQMLLVLCVLKGTEMFMSAASLTTHLKAFLVIPGAMSDACAVGFLCLYAGFLLLTLGLFAYHVRWLPMANHTEVVLSALGAVLFFLGSQLALRPPYITTGDDNSSQQFAAALMTSCVFSIDFFLSIDLLLLRPSLSRVPTSSLGSGCESQVKTGEGVSGHKCAHEAEAKVEAPLRAHCYCLPLLLACGCVPCCCRQWCQQFEMNRMEVESVECIPVEEILECGERGERDLERGSEESGKD